MHRGEAKAYLIKALSWWMSLVGKIGFAHAEDLVWLKFPRTCPYCLGPAGCVGKNCKPPRPPASGEKPRVPQWTQTAAIGARVDHEHRPRTLGQWQAMFASIYPLNQSQSEQYIYTRLCEELGELAEAIRLREVTRAFTVNEAVDVFAWLMAVANHLEPVDRDGLSFLDHQFAELFAEGCPECRRPLCKCDPILEDRVGRVADEVEPAVFATLQQVLLSSSQYLAIFGGRIAAVRNRTDLADEPEANDSA
jgi:hypothetical protein